MARRPQQQQSKEIATTVGTYPNDGPVVEMRGLKMAIPVTVKNKAAWMESKFREEQARLVAEEERKAREQQVLADRIAKQKDEATVEAQLSPLRDQVVGLQEQLAEVSSLLVQPDAATLVEISNSTTANMARTLDAAEKTRELIDQVEALQATVGGLATEVETLQAQTLQVNKNRLDFINEGTTAMGEQIRLRDERILKEQEHAVALSSEINANHQVVMAAKDVQKSTVEAARAQVSEVITSMTDDFVEMINLTITSLGLSQGDLVQNLNSVDFSGGRSGVRLTRQQIAQFADVYRKATAAINSEDERRAEDLG